MNKVIGITGSISTGKSTVSAYLITHGYKVVDADKLARSALDVGTKAYNKVKESFDCLNDDLTVNRQVLGDIVFHNQEKKELLESIIHPFVIDEMKKEVKSAQDLIFLDIPLLFESHLEYLCDKIIVVYVDENTQIQRLIKRNHIDEKSALNLMSQQISIEEKRKKADYVIDNRDDFTSLYQQIENILKEVKNETI